MVGEWAELMAALTAASMVERSVDWMAVMKEQRRADKTVEWKAASMGGVLAAKRAGGLAESWVGYLADYLADPTVGRWAGPSVPEKVETMAANSVDWTVESLAVWWVGLKAALMEWRTAAGTVVLSAEL